MTAEDIVQAINRKRAVIVMREGKPVAVVLVADERLESSVLSPPPRSQEHGSIDRRGAQ